MNPAERDNFARTFLSLFNDFSKEVLEHARQEKHEAIGECAHFHLPDQFRQFMMWLIIRDRDIEEQEVAAMEEMLDAEGNKIDGAAETS